MVSIKYVFIVLSADDDGEGGTFALYSLLARYSNIVRRDPNTGLGHLKLERHMTNDLKPMNNNVRNFIEKSAVARAALKILGVLGVAMVLADGVLTPAQVCHSILQTRNMLILSSLFWELFKESRLLPQISPLVSYYCHERK
jgi:hypothetical protein